MTAYEVIEKFGLDRIQAIDALVNFFEPGYLCDVLCTHIDETGSTDDFDEFLQDSFDPNLAPAVKAEGERTLEEVFTDQAGVEQSPPATSARVDTDGLREVCRALAATGISRIDVTYDGSGDSGAVEEVAALDGDGVARALPRDVRRLIEEAAYDLLPPGWEIDSGSYGTLTLDLVTSKGQLAHSARGEIDYSEEEFDL